jgi:hypothetical protein
MGSQTFNATGCFTGPAHVKKVCVQAWGKGGQGSTEYCCTRCPCFPESMPGAGGGGGGYGKGVVPITPGHVYNFLIGPSGTCGGCTRFQGDGGRLVGAVGGGEASDCIGGAAGVGFGNAATTTHCGTPGNTPTFGHGGKGACPCGGAGGAFGGGAAGSPPGGGGSGQVCHGGPGPGFGAHGRIILTWLCPPVITASATPKKPSPNQNVQFKTTVVSGSCLTYCWCFGCGAHSTCKCPTHSYAHVGTYAPKVVATNKCCGCGCATPGCIIVSAGGGKTGGTQGNFFVGRNRLSKISTSDSIQRSDEGGVN